jgi:hypothetical protein
MPKASDGRIPTSLFKAADIGSVYTYEIGKLSLRYPGRQPQPSHVPSHHVTHIFGHATS